MLDKYTCNKYIDLSTWSKCT